jgi:hypothetical protein
MDLDGYLHGHLDDHLSSLGSEQISCTCADY